MDELLLVGSCRALYCFSIARSIDLALAQQMLTTSSRTRFQHKSRLPAGGGTSPPLRLTMRAEPQELGRHATDAEVEIALYDTGDLCITWNVAVSEPLEELVRLSAGLYEREELIARSRALAEEVTAALGSSLERPRPSAHVEDYLVFQVEPTADAPEELLQRERVALARLLRAEEGALSEQEVDDALAHPVSYEPSELCLVDWLAAFLMGRDTQDERYLLELATVELLELRLLDEQLDREIGEAYSLLTRRRGLLSVFTVQRRELEHIARMQADDALMHEGVDNALKLFGDDYLARLYRTAAARLHFEDWDTSIQRKLGVLHTIHRSLSDLASHRRSELLEWIIIILIAVEIVLYLTPANA